MYCPNCRADVEVSNDYCPRCGTAVGARLCPNGHVMDPSWTECQYCPPGVRRTVAAVQPQAREGGTVVETAPAGRPPGAKGGTIAERLGSGAGVHGSFVQGATLLDDEQAARGRTTVEGPTRKGDTRVERRGPGGGKPVTVFDSGTKSSDPSGAVAEKVSQRLPKLVGWLVTFTHDPAGQDYRILEGKNVLGSEEEECSIVIREDNSVSGNHAVIFYRDGYFQIIDTLSTNGTYVNGSALLAGGAVVLHDGDRVRLGGTELVLYVLDH